MGASLPGFAVLVVDDDPRVADLHATFLAMGGYRVCVALDAHAALELAKRESYDLVLSDYEMHPANGLDLFEQLLERGICCPFVIITGTVGVETYAASRGLAVTAILAKPIASDRLLAVVAEILGNAGPRSTH